MSFTHINFASRPPFPAWLVPGLVVVLAITAWGGYRYLQAEKALALAKSQLLVQRQALARESTAPISSAPIVSKERVQSINEAIAALNTPWPALLGAIETARPREVALTRLEPRPKDQTVLVTAQADDMATLIAFMQKMSSTAPFVKTQPVRQELVLEGGMQRKQATFEARWEDRP